MTTREETPTFASETLVSGHFTPDHSYAVWRSRGSGDWLLFLTLGGEGRFGSGPAPFVTRPGQALLLRPGQVHDYGIVREGRRWDFLWVHFQPLPGWDALLTWPDITPGLAGVQVPANALAPVTAALKDVVTHAASGRPFGPDFARNALERTLLLIAAARPAPAPQTLDTRILRVTAWIADHPADDLSLPALAARAGLSLSRFAHLFRAETGLAPRRYVERARVARARQLLDHTREPISAIAAVCGFPNPFHFSARFRRETGLSPRAWRHRRRS